MLEFLSIKRITLHESLSEVFDYIFTPGAMYWTVCLQRDIPTSTVEHPPPTRGRECVVTVGS